MGSIAASHVAWNPAAQQLDDDPTASANAIAAWSDVGGYDAEELWDECTTRAFRESFDEALLGALDTFISPNLVEP